MIGNLILLKVNILGAALLAVLAFSLFAVIHYERRKLQDETLAGHRPGELHGQGIGRLHHEAFL